MGVGSNSGGGNLRLVTVSRKVCTMEATKRVNGAEVYDTSIETRPEATPSIETVVGHEEFATDMVRGAIPSAPAPTFMQKVGPNTVLTLIGLVVGAAVGWGIASNTLSNMGSEIRSLKTDIKVLQQTVHENEKEQATMRQWMVDHGVKLASPPIPPATNEGDR